MFTNFVKQIWKIIEHAKTKKNVHASFSIYIHVGSFLLTNNSQNVQNMSKITILKFQKPFENCDG